MPVVALYDLRGEALEVTRLKGWIARRGDRMPLLVNIYGITAAKVHVTAGVLNGPWQPQTWAA